MQTSARNDVTTTDDGRHVKVHGGAHGTDRAAVAAAALRHAAAHELQVPVLLDHDGATLTTALAADVVDGAAVLATSPATVLHAVGSVARRIHALPPPPAFPSPATAPAAWVHGDLCPVNLLFGRDHVLRAVVDWEDSHVGDPLVDLAWTEWLVRSWHPAAVEALPVLYAAHGRRTPPAAARRAAMRSCLLRHAARGDDTADWDAHLAALDGLDLDV